MALTTIIHCPECGATLKPGEGCCWMCSRSLEWNGSTVRVSAAPQLIYVPPPQPNRSYLPVPQPNRSHNNVGLILAIVLGALAMVPAIFIGFFMICLAAIDPSPGRHQDLAPTISAPTISVIVSMVVLILCAWATCIVCFGPNVRRR